MATLDTKVMRALQGYTDDCDAWPGPRIVKIFVASTFHGFREERRQLLEMVGPELQANYDDRNIEVEFVDMHYGEDGGDENNPALLDYYLKEIEICNRTSKAGYFLCMIGGDCKNYKPVLRRKLKSETFHRLVSKGGKQAETIKSCYKQGAEGNYNLDNDKIWFTNLVQRDEERLKLKEVQEAFNFCVMETGSEYDLLQSSVELECELALELLNNGRHPKGIIAVFKETPETNGNALDNFTERRLKKLQRKLEETLPPEHIVKVDSSPDNNSVQRDLSDSDDDRLTPFRDQIVSIVSELLDEILNTEPDQGKGRKKTVQEIFLEHITHLRIHMDHINMSNITNQDVKHISDTIIKNIKENFESKSKHTPVLVHGPDGSGKTTLLTNIYDSIDKIFSKPVLKIVRFSAATPRSAYNLELLRVMCQQISIILKIPEGYLPKDASFDPLYINNWFHSLLKRCEEMENEVLVIFIDNIHRVNPLDCDIVNGLSWLPMSLPKNVFMICTTAHGLDQLQLTPVQREKFKSTNTYYTLQSLSDEVHKSEIEKQFDTLEKSFGAEAFSKLACYITCSEFGLTETELLELVMPTNDSEAHIKLSDASFNFSTLCAVKNMMGKLLLKKYLSCRIVWSWRSSSAMKVARSRWVRAQSTLRRAHSDLAALHFAQHIAACESDTEDNKSEKELTEVGDDDALLDSTPFQSSGRTAAPFTQRHVEESWLHLLLAGDFVKLKDLTVCNFDFLLAAVQTVTISYLRCIVEHVRCYILDREVELVYGAVRRASDILTRDPMQLGAQIIAWLRPAVMRQGVLLNLVTAAMAWCDGYDKPLLVPLNGWLQPPIASTVRILNVGTSIIGNLNLLQLAPSGQHLIVATTSGDPQLWHIMSNSKVHNFKGHSGKILCMAVTRESQYLLTGSEDTTIIVWDLHTLTVKLKIVEHIAPVLCVSAVVSRSLVISGGEDSAVIVTSLLDGVLITKLDHHRGPVTGLKTIQEGEILVTSSMDGTVCTWRTDNFTLLSTICTINQAPINQMDISEDCVFLLTLEEDNELHLRTLITGTVLHTLKRHKSKVKCFAVARDSCRAVVCCADQRCYVYNMLSGALLRTLAAAHDVSAIAISDQDHFLFTAGGNRVTIYSFHIEDHLTNFRPTRQKKTRQTKSTTALSLLQAEQSELIPISCLEVSRDGQFAATGCARGLVRVWQLSAHKLSASLLATLSGHAGHVTCVNFAPNNLHVLSGSEDRTVVVWQLADHSAGKTYKNHTAAIQSLAMLSDSRRVMSGDTSGRVHVWLADSAIVLGVWQAPCATLQITNNMKFVVGTDGDNTVRIWSLSANDEEKRTVSHAERITCLAITADGLNLITGSEDMSLKVWQLDGGKLSQVLVGHTDVVTCVAVSVLNKTQIVSGSWDNNLIVWDINTGADLHLLSGHIGKVTCVRVTGDGTIAVSGAEDKTLIIWETKRGLALTSLALHVPLVNFQMTSDCSRIVVHLLDRGCVPIICLHNTPATYVKIPTYAAPSKDIDELRPLAPKRPMRRLLKKEVSLDTYTWQKKYGHLTSSAMMAQVDERLKRRFSVSASMEEISKIQQEKNKDLGSQASLGPEQAALAQSQHFDQLEALWNKISPPRRRSNKSLSKQSSLIESRFDSSDEDRTPVEEQEHMVE